MDNTFINFFNGKDNNDLNNNALDNFNTLCSNVIQDNNSNSNSIILLTKSIETFKNNIYFKDNISESLYNYIIDIYDEKEKEDNIFIYKEFLKYLKDYFILFYEPLLFKIKEEIIQQHLYDLNLKNENDIIDFLQTYIFSLLILNETLYNQINYLRKIGYGALAMYCLLNQKSKESHIKNAKKIQLQYIYEQDYIKLNYTQTLEKTSKPLNSLFLYTIKNFIENNTEDFIELTKEIQLRYNIFKIAREYIEQNTLHKDHEYDFVDKAYDHFLTDTSDFSYKWVKIDKYNRDINEGNYIITSAQIKF